MYLEHTIQICMPNSKKKPIKLNTFNKMSTTPPERMEKEIRNV